MFVKFEDIGLRVESLNVWVLNWVMEFMWQAGGSVNKDAIKLQCWIHYILYLYTG